MPLWAEIYEDIAGSYDVRLRSGFTWLDLAVLFNTVIEGSTFRAHVEGSQPRLSTGDGVLSGAIFSMIPSLLVPPDGSWDRLLAG